jgi:putative ABC transport system permease protein
LKKASIENTGNFRTGGCTGFAVGQAVRTSVRPLFVEPSRFLLNIGASTAAISLILLFQGFEVGLYQQLRSLPEQLPTPLVALQAGVTRLGFQRSVLPSLIRTEIEAVPGVRAAHPVAGVPLIYDRDGKRTPVYVIGYDTAGAPRRLTAGRQIEREREIVVDSALASKYGLAVGSEVEFVGAKFRIVGLSTGTASMLNPYVFARYVDLVDLYLSGDFGDAATTDASLLSFLLIETVPGTDVGVLRDAIKRTVPTVSVLTREELADNNVAMGKRMFAPILSLLVAISYVIGTLVVGLTTYVSVVNRSRDLAVMKAIGSQTGQLVRGVVADTGFVCAISLVLGIASAIAIARAIEWLAPGYSVVPWSLRALVRTSIAVGLIAGIGALAPLRQISSLEPAMAFRN